MTLDHTVAPMSLSVIIAPVTLNRVVPFDTIAALTIP
jgi:hypothetical protein